MTGRIIYAAPIPHTCEPGRGPDGLWTDEQAPRGSHWECDCGLVWIRCESMRGFVADTWRPATWWDRLTAKRRRKTQAAADEIEAAEEERRDDEEMWVISAWIKPGRAGEVCDQIRNLAGVAELYRAWEQRGPRELVDDDRIRKYLDQNPEVLEEFVRKESRRDPAWLADFMRRESRRIGT